MIRYNVSRDEILKKIEITKPGWLERAKKRTQKFVTKNRYSEKSGIWSDIKPVFMELQYNKCVYCERLISGERYGRLEHDLEHFRPKNSVKKWAPTKSYGEYSVSFGNSDSRGYFWLSYDIENYATSCKSCNTSLKSNYFPISEERGEAIAKVEVLTESERPYLCYPIGTTDEDPEKLVTFIGTVAIPRASGGHNWLRGCAIIEFFALNNREELTIERAQALTILGAFLLSAEKETNTKRFHDLAIQAMADHQPHAGCKRAFFRLWQEDHETALRILDKAHDITVS